MFLCAFIIQFFSINGYAETSSNPIMGVSFSGGGGSASLSSGGGGVTASGTITPDLFTGIMSYSIPIEVPAGRKGMVPSLTLTYRSNSSNGWIGVGWDLEIGAIERSTMNGVNFSGENYLLRMAGSGIDLVPVTTDESGNTVDFTTGSYFLSQSRTGRQILIGQAIVGASALALYSMGVFDAAATSESVGGYTAANTGHAEIDLVVSDGGPGLYGGSGPPSSPTIGLDKVWTGIKTAAPYVGGGGAIYFAGSNINIKFGGSHSSNSGGGGGPTPSSNPGRGGQARDPDYFSFTLNIGTIVGWSGGITLDRYGNLYWAPLGFNVGKSSTLVSASLTVGWLKWLEQGPQPSGPVLSNFLSGHAINFGAGYLGGGGVTWSPGNGTAGEFGFVSPQAGGSYMYSVQYGNLGVSW